MSGDVKKYSGGRGKKMQVKVLVRYQASKIVVLKWVNRCTILKILALGMRGGGKFKTRPGWQTF